MPGHEQAHTNTTAIAATTVAAAALGNHFCLFLRPIFNLMMSTQIVVQSREHDLPLSSRVPLFPTPCHI